MNLRNRHVRAMNRATDTKAAIAAAMMEAVKLADGIAGNTKDHPRDYRPAAGQIGALIKASIHPDTMAAPQPVKADAELRGIDIARKHFIERGHLAAAAAIRAMQGG